jgi:hypothetical protein
MDNKQNIDALKEHFKQRVEFNVDDVFRFYNKGNPAISRTTVNWKIHNLVQKGEIQRIGRGIYRLGQSNLFQPDLSLKTKKIAHSIKKEFPYANFCVWELAVVNYFSHNLINFNISFVDVERDATESVYYRLKEKNHSVVHIRKTYEDISELSGTVCVRPLVSHAPIQDIEKIPAASLEKILVDLATDKEFFPFQGNEIHSIYDSAFEKYTINESAMLRYASRKEKKDKVQDIIKTIKRQ